MHELAQRRKRWVYEAMKQQNRYMQKRQNQSLVRIAQDAQKQYQKQYQNKSVVSKPIWNSSWSSKNSKEIRVGVKNVMLASDTLFQNRQRSRSKAPMLSGLLGLLKQLLDSFFPLSTQYKGKPSRREVSLSFARTWMNFPFQSLYDCWNCLLYTSPSPRD